MRLTDLTGKNFAKFKVIKRVQDRIEPSGRKKTEWLCHCECGKQFVAESSNISSGNTNSCGCYKKQRILEETTRHGMSHTQVHNCWCAIRQRCENPACKCFHTYGGRGIKVCDRWQTFENFLADMGYPPMPKMSIDRIDVNGDYEPGNCRWATAKEQQRNRRNNLRITISGETLLLSELSDRSGISYATIRERIRAGWTAERAVTEPVRKFNRKP